MAKYRLTSDSSRSVDCDVLNESAGQYVVRFRNGVIRCVNKENVYAFDKIDEAVLDDIRGAANKVGAAIKKGYENVKLALSNFFKIGKFVGVMDGDGEVIPAMHPINIMTADSAKSAEVTFIPSEDVVDLCAEVGVRPIVINNHSFGDDGYVGLSYDDVMDESVSEPRDWSSAIFEGHYKDVQANLGSKLSRTRPDYNGVQGKINLSSRNKAAMRTARELADDLLDEYYAREVGAPVKPYLLWGAPGIGKSAIVGTLKTALKNEGYRVSVLTLSGNNLGPHDLTIPGLVTDELGKEKLELIPQTWLPTYTKTGDPLKDYAADAIANGGSVKKDASGNITEVIEGDGGILFIDEWSRLSFDAVNSLMLLPTAGVVGQGDHIVIGSRWIVCAAANRLEELSATNRMMFKDTQEGAQWSRFLHVTYVPTPSEWFAWAEEKNDVYGYNVLPQITSFIRKDIETVSEIKGKGDEIMNDIRNFSRSYFYDMSSKDDSDEAHACPRTWETLSNLYVGMARRKRVVEKGFGKTNPYAVSAFVSELAGSPAGQEALFDKAHQAVGAVAAKAFVEFMATWEAFDDSFGDVILEDGYDGDYPFLSKSWFTPTNAKDKNRDAIYPAIVKSILFDQARYMSNGCITEDAMLNVAGFYAKVCVATGAVTKCDSGIFRSSVLGFMNYCNEYIDSETGKMHSLCAPSKDIKSEYPRLDLFIRRMTAAIQNSSIDEVNDVLGK